MANVGEILPNTNDKVFEVQIRLNGDDPSLRPSMTTGNKIIMSILPDALYIPSECVHAGVDSIPFVYTKKHKKQIVVLGKANDKNVVVEKGLSAGSKIYLNNPSSDLQRFKLAGEEFIPEIRQKAEARLAKAEKNITKANRGN